MLSYNIIRIPIKCLLYSTILFICWLIQYTKNNKIQIWNTNHQHSSSRNKTAFLTVSVWSVDQFLHINHLSLSGPRLDFLPPVTGVQAWIPHNKPSSVNWGSSRHEGSHHSLSGSFLLCPTWEVSVRGYRGGSGQSSRIRTHSQFW